jgi:hypothetical protein
MCCGEDLWDLGGKSTGFRWERIIGKAQSCGGRMRNKMKYPQKLSLKIISS